MYREQIASLCQNLNVVVPDSQQNGLCEQIELLLDLVVKETIEKTIKVMEDKSKSWDPPVKDVVETLIACIRAKGTTIPPPA